LAKQNINIYHIIFFSIVISKASVFKCAFLESGCQIKSFLLNGAGHYDSLGKRCVSSISYHHSGLTPFCNTT